MASAVGLGASGPGGLTESIAEVALCLTLSDLLRQGLEAAVAGWGMAEDAAQLVGAGVLVMSKEGGTFSLMPGWEEAELVSDSAEIEKGRGPELHSLP